ncbi:MAG: hypothetical protein H5T50_07245, partial [Nitrososphaeria archaeon]|nr:hypothetical protein [Nitrososphaeria archaeon]
MEKNKKRKRKKIKLIIKFSKLDTIKSEIEKRNGKAIRKGNFVAKKIITKFKILYPKKF